jgi:hypothetical protein
VNTVKNVRIFGTASLENRNFLVIRGSDFLGKEKEGYILLDTVRAILPTKHIKPETKTTAQDLNY